MTIHTQPFGTVQLNAVATLDRHAISLRSRASTLWELVEARHRRPASGVRHASRRSGLDLIDFEYGSPNNSTHETKLSKDLRDCRDAGMFRND